MLKKYWKSQRNVREILSVRKIGKLEVLTFTHLVLGDVFLAQLPETKKQEPWKRRSSTGSCHQNAKVLRILTGNWAITLN